MENIMIFGAGQAGRMMAKWVNSDCNLLGFIDNNSSLWGECIENYNVYSVKEAMKKMPQIILITVLNKEAAIEIENQLRQEGYKGEVFNINQFKNKIDIRLSTLRLIAKEINERNIDGEVAELGVYKGEFAVEINRLFPNKKIYMFDTFEGFYKEDIDIEKSQGNSKAKEGDFSDTSVELVKSKLPYKDNGIFVKGYFPESIKKDLPEFCLVSLDTDLYKSTYSGLKEFYPRLVKGGIILIHDYNSMQFTGVKKAVRKFCKENNLFVIPVCDMHGSAILIKE